MHCTAGPKELLMPTHQASVQHLTLAALQQYSPTPQAHVQQQQQQEVH
jgi:hypothetical protein